MFRLLLRHDWKSIRGILGLLCLICLGAGIVGGFAIRFIILMPEQNDDAVLRAVLSMFSLTISFVSIGVTTSGCLFFCIWRFYRSRFSDEGYMTFTLPVTTHQILLSSLTATLLAMLCMVLAVMLSLGTLFFIGLTALPDFYADMARELPLMWEEIVCSFRSNGITLLTPLVCIPVAAVSEIVIMMLSVTIGSVAVRKLKVLAAIGVYYGINVVLSLANTIIMVVSGFLSSSSADFYGRFNVYPTIMLLILGTGGYFLMHYLTNRKLNLP